MEDWTPMGSRKAVRRPVRVLVVDDAPTARQALSDVAAAAGFDVVGQAGSGQEALRLNDELAPDMVLLDVQLPDIDGYEIADRSAATSPTTTVVLVSASSTRPGRKVLRKESLTPSLLRELAGQ